MSTVSEAEERLLNADEESTEREQFEETTNLQLSDREHARIRWLLYISHFLSTWNSRMFEFGAFLFLANIFPQTLLPASVYSVARAASAALLSPLLGSYIDSANRLGAVRLSIVSQRLAVASSCVLLYCMVEFPSLSESSAADVGFLSILSTLACVEKLGSVLNTISVERDWVVIVASGHERHLQLLNSQMRRIDLFCKLVGPLAIAFIDSASPRAAIAVTGGLTAFSIVLEYFSIARVYKLVPGLHRHKQPNQQDESRTHGFMTKIRNILSGTAIYIRHPAFQPSFSLALLYLTTLSFAGQMITYLVALGLPSALIGVLRGVSAIFELSATWLAPKIMNRIGPIRGGIWFINWQMFCVAIACVFFWTDQYPTIAAFGTVGAVIASRVGLWGFDLSAQIIIQEEVEPENRGTFSSQEFALQNIFEMLAFASTIVYPLPSQFKYPATISAAAVALAGGLFAIFVRSRRGHLIHLSSCLDSNARQKDHHQRWMRVANEHSGDNEENN